MQEVVERPIAELSKASEENITSSCERNSIGQNVVTKQDPNFSDQTCISLGGDKKCEENRSPLSRVNKHVSHLDYQMRSSESSSVTHLVSQTYNQVMSLGREYHRQQPFLSPSSYSRQNTSSGLEAVPSNPHTSTGVVGKTRTDTNTRKTKSEYLSAYPTATLNIRSLYPAAVQDDFSLDDNLGQQHRRPDRFTAFSNCNGQPIEQQNELVDSVWEPHGGDDTASLSSQQYFNNESPLLSTEMHYGDEIPSLSGWRCYGTEIPSLSSQLHCAAEIPSLSGLQSYGDEIPSLSSKWSYRNKSPLFSSQCHYGAEVPSLSNHRQGSFHGNGYSKDNIASKFGCSKDSIAGKVGYSKDSIAGKVVSISDQVKVGRNERAFTQPRMASRGVSSSEHYNVSKKSNVWRNPEVISDQVCGPRADKMNSTSRSCSKRDIMSPLIHRDHFNRSDFSVRYEHAKFFMIKSHCEDDIHKGIKYNVWASTPSGNNKLDAAFHEAQILMKEKGAKCPVFLFFSVNSSGQFAGLAEMLGPVDFKKTMDFWQQDKWNGFFPVMWHIIKDVPNRLFGHITLENNDNRIVTFSRDTQEIPLPQGLEMLEIFKSHPLGTSILDDFDFYEEKESSRRALKGNSQSMYPAKLPDDFKAMEHLEAGIQSLRFYD